MERPSSAWASDGSGRAYLWQGVGLWIGRSEGRTQWHDHHAHQLALAPVGELRFRTEADGRWTSFAGALVPTHCKHQFEADALRVAHLFVEPESRAGRALTERFGTAALVALPPDEARDAARALFTAFEADADSTAMQQAMTAAIHALCGAGVEPDEALDARLVRALDYIRRHIGRPLPLGEVAASVALSESRFRHLFVDGTGCSFRAYLLWLRINLAVEAVMAGASWTAAAHQAGFADSAHLSRTHKRMFGIEPSSMRPTAREAHWHL
ncbi:AraC family transcriptional regulator [Roseateles sp.]|uniref:AraC family transcriptional regulator n=1 Tax=Roseateles sp. TaxID=1971397 RepID=UPI0025EEDD52|nr:AraC family transcriptional regulator [Roseateles sp.]MBV8034720.1 helix-turn-helix domain-containing protein [Roseateles sp.]